MKLINKLKILKQLGFKYVETQHIADSESCGRFRNTKADVYTSETHQITHFTIDKDAFSCKDLSTTRSTLILSFNVAMRFYFSTLCQLEN